ncbi:hypothetical protein KC19_11G075700 [Ceratodon purpureus]|uniref:Uncharacterized protein n=1 Tax=Ceratodon purpureus TaxID=3225 RepID=A0A8T0GCC4_CERPU|nr:hypothetical protein KC19_11G075700 [Ceratodon purpureus]
MMASSSLDTSSEASGSMRSPLSSFMRSPTLSSMMPSPVSSRLTMEFETAFMMEAEDPIRFVGTDILPYLSQPSSSSSSSDFDTQSESQSGGSGSTSFCDLNDSNRITLGSLIGFPMADSFRNFGESLRFLTRGESHYDSGSNRTIEAPRRHRSCSLLSDIFRCLQRTRTEYIDDAPVARNLTNLTSFTITEVSEEEERDSDSDNGPTVFENSVFVERDTLGSRIYEFNPLYISDAMSEVDPTDSRATSLAREATPALEDVSSKNPRDSDDESTRSSIQVTAPSSPRPDYQPLSPMRSVLTAICCRIGDDCPSD